MLLLLCLSIFGLFPCLETVFNVCFLILELEHTGAVSFTTQDPSKTGVAYVWNNRVQCMSPSHLIFDACAHVNATGLSLFLDFAMICAGFTSYSHPGFGKPYLSNWDAFTVNSSVSLSYYRGSELG